MSIVVGVEVIDISEEELLNGLRLVVSEKPIDANESFASSCPIRLSDTPLADVLSTLDATVPSV